MNHLFAEWDSQDSPEKVQVRPFEVAQLEQDLRQGFEVCGFRVQGSGFRVWGLGFRV